MTWRVVAANFDQMHLNTNVRWARDHPDTEVVGLCDETPGTSTGSPPDAAEDCSLPLERRYDDLDRCLAATDPDIVLGGPMNADHAGFVERVAAAGAHVAVEKPMAVSLADADRMLDAAEDAGVRLAVNWPVTWDPVHNEVQRLVEAGTIGDVYEINFYGGNAGAPPDGSWFYDADAGGGSLLDYLGYGVTFSTWFRGGDLPESVAARTWTPEAESADRQSTTVCRYDEGLSTLQTSLRMFTHPWEHPSTPAKGYDLTGTRGTITTRQHDIPIRVQTEDRPDGYAVEPSDPDWENLVAYLVYCLEHDEPFEGPTDPAFCRETQRIIETARASAAGDGAERPLAGDPR